MNLALQEDNILADGKKIAYLRDGQLRMLSGHATDRPAVEAFLDTQRTKGPEEAISDLAGILYTRYCAAVGGLAWNGDPLPNWDDFVDDPAKEKQVSGWIAVAEAALEELGVVEIPACTFPAPLAPTPGLNATGASPAPFLTPPAGNARDGDKDPEVIAWWFKNHPAEAEKRYAGRKIERPA